MTITNSKEISTWLLDADNYKSEIQNVAKLIRKQERHEKNLELVRKKLDGQTKTLTSSTSRYSGAMSKLSSTMQVAAGNLLSAGIQKLSSAMRDGIQTALDYEDWIGKDASAIERLSNATGGLIGDLDLARARTRLTTGDFKLSEEQIAAVARAAIHLTRVYKTSFSTSLDKVTNTIKTGSSKAFKELGFNMDLLGTAAQKTDTAIKKITERFNKDFDTSAQNTNERLDKMGNAWDRIVGQTGTQALGFFTQHVSQFADMVDLSAKASLKLANYWRDFLAGPEGRLAAMMIGAGGLGTVGTGLKGPGSYQTSEADKAAMFGSPSAKLKGLRSQRGRMRSSSTAPKGKQQSAYDMIMGDTSKPFNQEFLGEANDLLNALTPKEGGNWGKVADGILQISENSRLAIDGQLKLNTTLKDTASTMQNMAVGGLANLTGGLWQAADAAILGGESFGVAMAKMTKATLLGVAQQATVQGMFHMAKYIGSWFTSIPDLKAAGLFFATAAVAGGAGLGMSAGGVGRSASSAARAPMSQSSTGSTGYSPSIGTREDRDAKPIVINAYFGDPSNRSAALMTFKQMKLDIAQASK